jgi:4-carboxymuconolactone decarboxylase
MTRIPDIVESSLTPEQRKVYDAIVSGPRGRVGGPLRVWLHSPKLADRAQSLGAFCRYDTSLPQRLAELAIITTGAHWRAGYEWNAHAPRAVETGIAKDAVEAIRTGRRPSFERSDEAAVYAFANELLTSRTVSEPTFKAAHQELGTEGIVDLVGILGYYTLISMTICAFKVAPGGTDPFATST